MSEALQCLGRGLLGYGNSAGRQLGTGTGIRPGDSASRERALGAKAVKQGCKKENKQWARGFVNYKHCDGGALYSK